MLSRYFTTCLSVIGVLFLCTACTGITEKQLALDPVFTETEKINNFVSLERSEFFRFKDEYIKTRQADHLERMSELMELMRDELEHAEYFQKNYRYYRKGIDYERWKSAQNTYRLCRKTLCEMMLATGELHMMHGNREYAVALFNAVVSGFEDKEFSGYVDQAREFLQEIEEARLYASSKKPVIREGH